MKTKSVRPLGCSLLLVTTTAGPCLAADELAEGLGEAARDFTGTVELGVGHADDANYRYGRYTGIDDSSAYVIGNFDLGFRPGRPDYLKFRGRDLGLDSRWLQLEYGEQGNYETYIEYNQLPHLISDSAKTPYVGDGGDNLVVGPGLSPTNLRSIELETERKQVNAGAAVFLPKDWKVSLDVRHEKKDGTDWIGGALQRTSGGAGISIGQTYAVILPEPIDQTTTEMDAALEYNGEKSQLRFTLHGSLFDNDNKALRWEEPGFTTGGGTTLPPAGQLALPPDNRFFQAGVSASTLVGETTRLTGLLSVGLMQQDEDFLPYGLSGALGDPPRKSLDGEVYVYSARAAVSSRPYKPLRLNARYRYDERDNRTPEAAYLYDVMDSGKTPNPPVAVVNEPLSYRKHKIDFDANYRFNEQWRGLAGYEFRHTERDNADVERSDEHTVKARLAWQPRDDLDAALKLAESRRDIDDYEAELTNQNPLLRKYNQADRDRSSAGLRVNYTPYENVNLGFGFDLTDDDYSDSELGLTDAESRSYTLDVGYYPTEDVQFTAFYVRDDIESKQRGSETGSSPTYKVDFDDAIDTFGVGMNVAKVANRWDLGVNYRYSKGEGDIEHTDLVAPGASSEYPTLKNSLHAIEFTADYRWSKQVTLKTAAVYEHFEADDWAVDDIGALVPSGNPRLLTLDTESEDYDVFALMIAVQYRF